MNYRYFEDLNNNEYRWSIQTNDDGYYSCGMYKYSSSNGWARYRQTKSRLFRKRNMAKSWCLKHVRSARARQEIVLNSRAERKQVRLDAKPTYTKLELDIMKIRKDSKHIYNLTKKIDTKIRGLTTRKETYEKKLCRLQKTFERKMAIKT